MAQRRKLDGGLGHLVLRNMRQQMRDKRDAATPLVVEIDQTPGRVRGVRCAQHGVAGAAVVGIFGACLQIDRAEFPAFERIGQALAKRSSCCAWSTVSQYLNSRMSSSTSNCSNTGVCFRKALASASVQ